MSKHFEVLQTIANIITNHEFDEDGICRDPGRTAGESLETLYFDAQEFETDSFGDQQATNFYRVFEPSIANTIFASDANWFILEYTSQGFVRGTWVSKAEVDHIRQSIEDQLAEDDEANVKEKAAK